MSSKENTYRIAEVHSSPLTYALLYKEEVVGTLTLRNRHASEATASFGDRTILFRRQKALKKDLHMHESTHDSPIATFKADAFSRGKLTLGSSTYRWAPTNTLLSSWAWFGETGEEILRIRPTLHFAKSQGAVESKHRITQDSEKVLALAGWYLLLLGYQDPGTHLLTSLEIWLRNKTTAST